MIKHCDLCKNKNTMNCPNSTDCYNNVERPYFDSKYLYCSISLLDKIRLLFAKTHISSNTVEGYTSKMYYKILHNNIYIVKTEVKKQKEGI